MKYTELCIYLDHTENIVYGPCTNLDKTKEELNKLREEFPDWRGHLHMGVRMVTPWCECADGGIK